MIADFIVDKMSAYIAGGMEPETAARFTRGELQAIYKGVHYGRDSIGGMRQTEPPENVPPDEAMEKCAAAINEILKTCAEMAKEKTEPTGAVPEGPEQQAQGTQSEVKRTAYEGFEKMAEYARRPA